MSAPAEHVAPQHFIARYGAVVYGTANVVFMMLASWGYTLADVSIGRPLYLAVLFALCSAPILVLKAYNDRYALLGIFMAEYFILFGMQDFLSLFSGGVAPPANAAFLSETECLIIAAAVATLLGYLTAAGRSRTSPGTHAMDWPAKTILTVGLGLTALGTLAFFYFHIVEVTVNTNRATGQAFASMGPALTFLVMLGQLIRPLGLLILAYGYARFRTFFWFTLVLAVLASQILLGFLGDTKSLPLQAAALIILARVLIDNRLPRAWMLGGVVGIAIIFPLFQAYRAEVAGERGMNRAQAAQNLEKVLEIVMGARDKVSTGRVGERSQTFFERASLKGNVELAVERVGVETPFQLGHTLIDLPLAFVPRLMWPNKPTVPAGQLFNKAVVRGEGDTFVSPSHLGELYWNFGWPGAVAGMFFIGSLLGYVGAKSSLAESKSATRLLILLATVDGVCLGFEGSIAIAYVVWLRSLAAIAILHALLARRQVDGTAPTVRAPEHSDAPTNLRAATRFPNLMR